MATNGNVNHVAQSYTSSTGEPVAPTQTSSDHTTNTSKSDRDLPKDEVGWYFVEQYYTTLSKNPEKLHLFYGKQSQFANGQESQVVAVAAGRSAIQQRIKDLNFQDCKVRISNVDSQASGENIVIQVIGETSNNGAEPKKFVQTFILAQQPSGYFVLNDILRYINDFADEEFVEPEQPADEPADEPAEAPAASETELETEPKPAVVEEVPTEQEPAALDTEVVDKKLEEVEAPVQETPAPPAPVEPAAETAPEATKDESAAEPTPDPEKAAEEVVEEEAKKVEDPKAPTPTPAAVPVPRVATPVVAEPEKPKEPPKPLSWAGRVAAAAGPKLAAAVPKFPTPAVPALSRPSAAAAAVPAAKTTATPTPTPAAESTTTPATSQDQGSEWQTAETKRQNRPQSQAATPPEKEGAAAYIKFVTEKVKDEDLRSTLAAYGELFYFDINRSKNCAFVEFKTQAGYNAAAAANPHLVNGESVVVEPRRPKANAYGGTSFNTARGGAAGRGRGGFEPGRSSSQGGRGGFPGQTRGGRGGAPRGRGAQVGAA